MKLWQPKRKYPKVVPIHLQNHVVWSWTLKCSVKSYVTGPSTKCYFNEFMSMIKYESWTFRVPWSLGFVLGLHEEVVLENNPSDHETWSVKCHVGIHVDFYIHLAFTYSLCWSLKRSVSLNLDRLHLFHQWECLKCNGVGLSVSCGEWPLGPLHKRAKSRDLVMVRTFDSQPKAVPWVLGKPF